MVRKSINAKVVDKRCFDYFQCPGKVPEPKGLYEVDFMSDDEELMTFEVSVFVYNVLEIGQKGLLTYENKNIIRFGDYIREFTL